MSDSVVVRLRLRNQSVLPAAAASPADAVRSMLAMQGQDFRALSWAIGLRTAHVTAADVSNAYASGEIVRSWPMRGTLHAMAAEDLGWMLSLTAERIHASAATRRRQLGIDTATIDKATEAAAASLAGDGRLDRAEMLQVFEEAGIATTGQRGYHLISILALNGLICWGPPAGNGQALVLSDEWIRSPRRLDRDAALGEAVRRYFSSHGPATIDDFAWWSGLTLTDARRGVEVAGEALESADVGSERYWHAASPGSEPPSPSRAVRMLPGFDEYLLGYRDRSHILAAEHSGRIVPGGNGVFKPVLVAGGRVVGTWRRENGSASEGIRVRPEPFAPLTDAQVASLRSAARRYGHFLQRPVTLGPVS